MDSLQSFLPYIISGAAVAAAAAYIFVNKKRKYTFLSYYPSELSAAYSYIAFSCLRASFGPQGVQEL